MTPLGRMRPSLHLRDGTEGRSATGMNVSELAQTLQKALTAAKGREAAEARLKSTVSSSSEEEEEEEAAVRALQGLGRAKIVLISGFESFNVKLYRDAAKALKKRVPGLQLIVFSDRDIATNRVRENTTTDWVLHASGGLGSWSVWRYGACVVPRTGKESHELKKKTHVTRLSWVQHASPAPWSSTPSLHPSAWPYRVFTFVWR